MSKTKILFVTQEMKPYTALSEISEIARRLPQHVQDNGMEIRILMPRYGTINERRHRLHEVVRLSGMNIIVNNDDYPLIIKVASLPGARMQVYFLDNDDFFKRKSVFEDAQGQPFEDNAERAIFFCKGVLETVKKFGWAPDLVHCHGWMTSLIPLYIKTGYKTEPLFAHSKVVYSAYSNSMEGQLGADFVQKAKLNETKDADFGAYLSGDRLSLNQGAAHFSDALVLGSNDFEAGVVEALKALDKPIMEHPEGEAFAPAYQAFFEQLLADQS